MNKCTETLNNEQINLKTIDKQIETLDDGKKAFEEQINQHTKTLDNEKENLKTIDQQIKTLDDGKKAFEEQIDQHTKALNKEQKNLNTIDPTIEQLNQTYQQLENEIQREIAEKYDLTSNKIKKWGIGVSVIGGVGTISVGLIPGVNIVFIAVPSSFALLGIILLGIYFYRNSKKPPRETTIITEPVYNDSKKSITETIENVVEKDKSVADQKLNNNENIITTQLEN